MTKSSHDPCQNGWRSEENATCRVGIVESVKIPKEDAAKINKAVESLQRLVEDFRAKQAKHRWEKKQQRREEMRKPVPVKVSSAVEGLETFRVRASDDDAEPIEASEFFNLPD